MPLSKINELQLAKIEASTSTQNAVKDVQKKINELVGAYNNLLDALRNEGINV